ncbi:MAG TPA: hypothetical protein PLD53_01525 [Candidatus Propionivibrio aalborgensis]|nr:hypothetical protein [Candidatus Propionivibrio aalborgensis]
MNMSYVRTSGQIAYVDRLRDFFDKWLFFIFFTVGAMAIVALKAAEYAQWQVTAAPVGLMLFYAFYAYFSPGFRLREDRIADNLYYLGFLYTLSSLAYSLYLFSQDQANTTTIISNFGIALVTTIVGLALRVLFSQLREDPVEYEREARYELSEAVRHLKTELDESVLDFNSFRRSLQQSLQEGTDEMLVASKNLLNEHSQQFVHVTQRFVTVFDQSIATFAHESARANIGIAGVATELASLITRINEIEAPKDLVKHKIEPAVATITQLVEQTFARTQSETIYFDRLHTLLEKVGGSHQQLEQTLAQLVQANREQATSLQQESQQVRAMVASLCNLVAEASAGVRQHADIQAQQVERFSRNNEALIEKHQQMLGSELQLMRDRLHTLMQEGSARQATMDKELEQLRLVVTGLGQAHAPLEQLDRNISAQMNALARLTINYEEAAIQAEGYSTALNHSLQIVRQSAESLAQSSSDHTEIFNASLQNLEQTLTTAINSLQSTLKEQIQQLVTLPAASGSRSSWFGWLRR